MIKVIMSTMYDLADAAYKYFLVEFSQELDEKGNKIIEIIPRDWLDYVDNKFTAYYPPPPYDDKHCERIRNTIAELDDFNVDWDTYDVILKGRAKTHQEATKKLGLLKKQSSVLTTDGEGQSKAIENAIIKKINEKKEATKVFDKKNLKTFDHSDCSEGNSSQEFDPSEYILSSSSSNSPKTPSKKKKTVIYKGSNFKTKKDLFCAQITSTKKAQLVIKSSTHKYERLKSTEPTSTPLQKCDSKSFGAFSSKSRDISKKPSSQVDMISKQPDFEWKKMADHLLLKFEAIFKTHNEALENQLNRIATKLDSVCLEQANQQFSVVNALTFENKYEIQLPIDTIEKFDQFDEKLTDKEAAKDLENSMVSLFSANISITRNITNIMKAWMKKEVALNFTALKKNKK